MSLPGSASVAARQPKLAARLYLLGIGQFAGVLLGLVLLGRAMPSPARSVVEREARYVASVALVKPQELAALHSGLGGDLKIYDAQGSLLLASPQAVPTAGGQEPWAVPVSFAIQLPSGAAGRVVYVAHPPSPSIGFALATGVLLLLVVACFALLMARSLARPLAQLSAAATAFGQGNFRVRARLLRRDELGELAAAFDDMADRIVQLLDAQRELLANVSHELRSPLARIRVALDLADEGSADTAKQSLLQIGKDLAELERLVSDILTAARLDVAARGSGGLPLRLAPSSLQEICEQSERRFASTHRTHRIELHLPADRPLWVLADPVLLRRAIDNLLDNAARYSEPEKGQIILRLRDQAGAATVEIEDFGIGMNQEELALVFTPFFRADRSRNRATGGLGLGLVLTKRILEAHRGTIALESKPSGGLRVRCVLPLQSAPTLAAAEDGRHPLGEEI